MKASQTQYGFSLIVLIIVALLASSSVIIGVTTNKDKVDLCKILECESIDRNTEVSPYPSNGLEIF